MEGREGPRRRGGQERERAPPPLPPPPSSESSWGQAAVPRPSHWCPRGLPLPHPESPDRRDGGEGALLFLPAAASERQEPHLSVPRKSRGTAAVASRALPLGVTCCSFPSPSSLASLPPWANAHSVGGGGTAFLGVCFLPRGGPAAASEGEGAVLQVRLATTGLPARQGPPPAQHSPSSRSASEQAVLLAAT